MQTQPARTCSYMGVQDPYCKERMSVQEGIVIPNDFITKKSHGISEEGGIKPTFVERKPIRQ